MKNKILKILLVEDHQLVRNGFKLLLNQQHEFTPEITEASNGEQGLDLALEHNYDIILLDIEMPIMDGIEMARKLIQERPGSKILALTMHDEESIIHEMLSVGVKGYVLKNVGIDELAKAIQTVLNNKKYYSNEVSQLLLEKPAARTPFKQDLAKLKTIKVKDHVLSRREFEMLELIAQGLNNDEIAQQLHLSKRTVEGNKLRLKQKLNLNTMAALTNFAHEAVSVKKDY